MGCNRLGKTIENYLDLDFKILFVHVVLRILLLPDTEFTWYDSAVKCLVHTRVELLIVQNALLSTLLPYVTYVFSPITTKSCIRWKLVKRNTPVEKSCCWMYNREQDSGVACLQSVEK